MQEAGNVSICIRGNPKKGTKKKAPFASSMNKSCLLSCFGAKIHMIGYIIS